MKKMTFATLLERAASAEADISAREAAEFLDLKPKTLANRRVLGLPPAFFKRGSRVRYKICELLQYTGEVSKK